MKNFLTKAAVCAALISPTLVFAQWQSVGSGSNAGINNSPLNTSVNIGASSTNTAYKFRVYTAGDSQKGMRIHNTYNLLTGSNFSDAYLNNHALTISYYDPMSSPNVRTSSFVDFYGNASFKGKMSISGGNSLDLSPVINPNFSLFVDGLTYSTGLASQTIKVGTTNAWQYSGSEKLYVEGTSKFTSTSTFNGTVNMNGVVNIGGVTTSCFPDYKLFVGGGILAEKVRVAVPGGSYWCDYVFEEDYNLMSIYELKNYLVQNKHLPNIPSEQEVIKDGVDLLEVNRDLLKTVEELTLYVIQLQEQIDEIKKASK